MARADTRTLLPLTRFAQLLGLHPLHFNQVYLQDVAPTEGCGAPILQYSWQGADRLGREDIAQAIAQAEAMIADYVGFRVAPTWEVADGIRTPTPSVPGRVGVLARGLGWRPLVMRAAYGYWIAAGIEAQVLIDNDAAIVYTDTDGDGYKETATVTVAVDSSVAVDEVAIYYPGALGSSILEIRPIRVSIVDGTATITFRREEAVQLALTESFDPRAVDGANDDNFLSAVEVYRRYTDDSRQARGTWEGSYCDDSRYSYQDLKVAIHDNTLGTFSVLLDGCTEWALARTPEKVEVWYYGGYPTGGAGRAMAPVFERAVTSLAATFLDRPLCSCTLTGLQRLNLDLAERSGDSSGSSTSFATSRTVLDNPFGTKVGAVEAWRLVRNLALGRAVSA